MPNWVSNTVTPLNEAAVSFTRERIVDEKGEFCFGRLVPLPRELSKTSSPNRIVSPEEMQAFKERYAERVHTEYEQEGLLYVEHPSGFIESCCTAECARNLIKQFGAADWYTFTNSHWGCKWDACCRKHDDTSYFFDTPWSYPETFTEVMATSCPGIRPPASEWAGIEIAADTFIQPADLLFCPCKRDTACISSTSCFWNIAPYTYSQVRRNYSQGALAFASTCAVR